MSSNSDAPPVKPRKLSARIDVDGDTLIVCPRDFQWFVGIFMTLWLTIWTIGGVALLWKIVTNPQPSVILFAVPFWSSWVFVAVCLAHIFARNRLILGPNGVSQERHFLVSRSCHRVPLSEIRRIQRPPLNTDPDASINNGIEVITVGRGFTFGTFWPVERDWLAHQLDEHRQHLQGRAGVIDLGEDDLTDCRGCGNPSDSLWSVSDESADLTFQQQGRFDSPVILGMVLINGFWNGGVIGLAVFGEKGPMAVGFDWWAQCALWLALGAAGLMMFIGLLYVLAEPFRLTRWVVGREAIEQVTTRFGLRLDWHYRYPCNGLREATIRDDLGSYWSGPENGRKSTAPDKARYGLLLVDAENQEICSIKELTLGEARGMKGRLQERGYAK